MTLGLQKTIFIAITATALLHITLTFIAPIYSPAKYFLSFFCHQSQERCVDLLPHYHSTVCARCLGIYIGCAIGAVVILFTSYPPFIVFGPIGFFATASVILKISGVDLNNAFRLIAGMALGICVPLIFWIFPAVINRLAGSILIHPKPEQKT